MCYSSMEEYGWRNKREADRKPEARQETPPDRPEPHYTAQDFTFWAFPRRRKTHEAQEPAAESTRERV
ncbi:hypothetical protein GU243_17460 [Pseudarthrobacter psychrotolerans]|uniref:Uncharacterized protein n=1 Tax=Pseudarthrobacter psychrotolerans TaxID=2697569 RepID=A0A6P1NNH3_9MICC|nr:hypothetical protein [Pseudarthrobacter psychrotolerans]QHK21199.1 hypothetical protein GU243_17460 [Pseudarthrobacter psychrotolerans]